MRLHSRLPGSPTSCVWNLIVEFTAAQIHLYRGRIYQKVPKTKSLEKSLKSVKNPKQLRSKWYFKLLPSLINARTRGFLDREPALVARQLHHCAFWCHCTAHGLEQPTMRWWDDEVIPGQRSVICSPASETCRFRDFFFTATRKGGNPASLLSQKWKKIHFSASLQSLAAIVVVPTVVVVCVVAVVVVVVIAVAFSHLRFSGFNEFHYKHRNRHPIYTPEN